MLAKLAKTQLHNLETNSVTGIRGSCLIRFGLAAPTGALLAAPQGPKLSGNRLITACCRSLSGGIRDRLLFLRLPEYTRRQ